MISQLIDSVVFVTIAFWGVYEWPVLIETNYLFVKVGCGRDRYAICLLGKENLQTQPFLDGVERLEVCEPSVKSGLAELILCLPLRLQRGKVGKGRLIRPLPLPCTIYYSRCFIFKCSSTILLH